MRWHGHICDSFVTNGYRTPTPNPMELPQPLPLFGCTKVHKCSHLRCRFNPSLNLHLLWGLGAATGLHRTSNLGLGSGSVQVREVRELDPDQFSSDCANFSEICTGYYHCCSAANSTPGWCCSTFSVFILILTLPDSHELHSI